MRKKHYQALLILFVSVFLFQNVRSQTELPSQGFCAHRGDQTNYPENTLPAFLAAIYSGAQMIECDLQLTKDSVLVIIHDATVDRTTDGKGRIKDFTFDEIRQLDAGIKKGEKFKGTKIPTFKEVLSIMPRNIWINCHIKGGRETARKAAQVITKQGRSNQAFLACSREAAHAAKTINKQILICNMDERERHFPNRYTQATIKQGANFIQFYPREKDSLKRSHVNAIHHHEIKASYYQSESLSVTEVLNLFDLGIDFILVNDIKKFMPLSEILGAKPVDPIF